MRLVLTVGAVVLAAGGLAWMAQRRLIYLPTQDVGGSGSGVEEVVLATEDGLSLSAWYVAPAEGRTGWTVVVFPGNAGNRADRMGLAERLAAEGLAVLLVDYRGYGGNPGRPSEAGLAADARAAAAYVQDRAGVDPSRVAYFGESLGAGVAVALATEQPPAALVLRSPFTSLPDAAGVHYPFLPVAWLLWDDYPNLERIADLGVPTLVVAGTEDGIVPFDQSRAVFEAAAGPKRLVVVEGADHNDPALTAGPRLVEEVVAFLESVPVLDG